MYYDSAFRPSIFNQAALILEFGSPRRVIKTRLGLAERGKKSVRNALKFMNSAKDITLATEIKQK